MQTRFIHLGTEGTSLAEAENFLSRDWVMGRSPCTGSSGKQCFCFFFNTDSFLEQKNEDMKLLHLLMMALEECVIQLKDCKRQVWLTIIQVYLHFAVKKQLPCLQA